MRSKSQACVVGDHSSIVLRVGCWVLDDPNEVVYPVFFVVRYDEGGLWQHLTEFRKVWVRGLAGNGLEFLERFGKEGRNVVGKHVVFDVVAAVGGGTAAGGDIH